jgi:hypothetical protein
VDEKRFEIVPPGKHVLIVPVLVVLLAIGGFVVVQFTAPQRTPVPWPAWLAFAVMPVIAGLIAMDMLRRDVRLDDAGLRLRTLPWRSTVKLSELDLERAEIVDLYARKELMPRVTLMGSRLPGYRSGVFRLRDKRRASVLVTDTSRVLVLPKRDGSVILLSLQRPEALLEALRHRRG